MDETKISKLVGLVARHRLASELIALSSSKVWEEAKTEWYIWEIYYLAEPETCLCGHKQIYELCILRNRINCKIVPVENECACMVLDLPSDFMFRAIHRISKNITSSINNIHIIDHAFQKKWINAWEHDLYVRTMRMRTRTLADKLSNKRTEINLRILANTCESTKNEANSV